MRLIDADALINELVNSCNNDQTKMFPVWIEKQIDAQPTIPYTGSVGIRQTSDSIEFTVSGDAQHGYELGITIGKMMMLDYIWKNCLWGNVMTDGVLDILKKGKKEISYE